MTCRKNRTLVFHGPFGSEYSLHPKWSFLERWFMRLCGVVDLPSRLRARIVFRELPGLAGTTFLDLGSGTGTYSFYLGRARSNSVQGIDIDSGRVEDCDLIARRLHLDNVTFSRGSGHLGLQNFQSESFDGVLAIEVMQCLPDPRLALSEIHRVLKPGGHLVGHVPVLDHLREHELWLFDDNNLPQLLTGAGFEVDLYVRTFGKGIRSLCRIFEWTTRSRPLVSFIFPALLLTSFFFKIQSPQGMYRFFVARKPVRQGLARTQKASRTA
jgi:SAM-dependent methyltransferase